MCISLDDRSCQSCFLSPCLRLIPCLTIVVHEQEVHTSPNACHPTATVLDVMLPSPNHPPPPNNANPIRHIRLRPSPSTTSSPNGPLTNLCATKSLPNSGTHSAFVLQNCSFWGIQSRPARSRIPAGMLMISSFRGVKAETFDPQILQNARCKD